MTTTDLDPLLMRSADDTLHVYTVPFSAGVTGPCWSEELLLTTEPLPSVHLNILPLMVGPSEQLSSRSLPIVSCSISPVIMISGKR